METEIIKVVLIGEPCVGKTCLIEVIVKDKFPEGFFPGADSFNIQNESKLQTEVDGQKVEVYLRDTQGQHDYDNFTKSACKNSDVVVLCFSIDSRDSFENIENKWFPQIKNNCPDNPIILVANKKDLRNDQEKIKEMEEMDCKLISSEEGQILAVGIDAFVFLECSAKNKEGVKEIIESAVRAVKTLKEPLIGAVGGI